MRRLMNTGILRMSESLDCDYPFAVGLFFLIKEMIDDGRIDILSTRQIVHELGIMSQKMTQKLSQMGRDGMRDMICDAMSDIKRDDDRYRQRDYRERKRRAPSSPPSPTPLSPLLSPQEKESENAPVSLRETPPQRVTRSKTTSLSVSRSRFKKPSVEEIQQYCAERKNSIDAQRFYDYYESKGWVIGKNSPIKDWKACVRTWEHSEFNQAKAGDQHAKPTESAEIELDTERAALFDELLREGGGWG